MHPPPPCRKWVKGDFYHIFKFLKFKPIRKEGSIIKTASHVCHDKWRGVIWENDGGACSRFFLVSSFCPQRKKKMPEYQLNIQLDKVELFHIPFFNTLDVFSDKCFLILGFRCDSMA